MKKGEVVSYERYRSHFAAVQESPVHWPWSSICAELSAARPAERGSLTLSKTGGVTGCELIPGMSINVQIVPAGGSTRSHTHAWWHLFLVRDGQATAILGETKTELAPSDLLLVPAWTPHHFENSHEQSLILLSMSNLPQQHALSNHRAVEPESQSVGGRNSRHAESNHG